MYLLVLFPEIKKYNLLCRQTRKYRKKNGRASYNLQTEQRKELHIWDRGMSMLTIQDTSEIPHIKLEFQQYSVSYQI